MTEEGQKRRISRALKYVLLLLMGLLILTGVGVLPINLFFVKDAIHEAVRQNLGVELEIRGPLKLRLGFKPQLSASELSLHLPGAQDQPLLVVNHLSISPVLFKIFRGDIHLRSLNASDVFIDYCPESFPQQVHDPIDGATDGDTPSFSLQKLKLDQVQLFCDHPDKTLPFVPEMLNLEASAGRGQAVRLRISGEHAGQAIELSATMGSLDELKSDPPAFPLQVHLSAFDSVLDVEGAIQDPLSQPSLAARIEFKSGDPADLMTRAGFSVPPLESLQFKAEVKAGKDVVELNAVEGRLGQARFSLSGLARGFTERPFLQLQAQLPAIDLDKLPAGTRADSSTEIWQDISLQPLIEKLQQFDAEVRIDIEEILGTLLSIENLSFSGRLNPGELHLDRAELVLAGSPLSATAGLNLNAECPQLTSELQLGEFDLATLNPIFDLEPAVGGSVKQADITTKSCGETLGQHADSLQVTGDFHQAEPIFQGVDLSLNFDTLEIELSQHLPGRLQFNGSLFEEPLSAEIAFGPLAELLSEATWPLTLKANGAGSNLLLDGNAAFVNGIPILDVQLNLDITRLDALQPWIASVPDSPLAGKASTRFRFQESGWSLADVDIRLGQSDLHGHLARSFSENGPLLSARLTSNLLEIAELTGLITGFGDETAPAASAALPGLVIDDEWIEKWFTLPSVDFEFDVKRIAGIDYDVGSVNIVGHVRERLIEDSHLSLDFERINIAGDINADFRHKPWKLAYHVDADHLDIGHLLARFELADDISIGAKHLDLDFISEGQSISDLLLHSRLEAHMDELIWTERERQGEGPANELLLNQVEFTAQPSSPTYWSANGILNEVPVRLWMQTPSIPETLNNQHSLPIHLVLSAGQDVAIIDTVIDRQSDGPFNADLAISGQRMNLEGVEIADLQSPLDDYELSTRITVRERALDLTGLEARLGTSSMAGQVNVETRDDLVHFAVRLDSPFIETEDFVSWLAQWRSVEEKKTAEEVTDSKMKEDSEGFIAVINRELDEFTRDYSFDLTLAVEKLYSLGNFLGKAEIRLAIDENEFHLGPLKISHPDHEIDAEYQGIRVEEGLEASLSIHAERLEYGGLLRLFDSDSKASGQLYLDTSLVATAPHWSQLDSAMQGHLDLLTIPNDFEAGFLDLWASNLIFSLLRTTSQSDKKMNCLVARLEAEDGVMSSKQILLDSTDIIVHGRGSIDLGKRELDLLFAPQAKVEKFLSVSAPIGVKGPFDDYKIGVVRGEFVMTLFRWYLNLIYVPYKWMTGERFPADGLATCYQAMDWDEDDIRVD